jgi:hypothetical protein
VREEQLLSLLTGPRPYLLAHLRRGVAPEVVKAKVMGAEGESTRRRMQLDLPTMLPCQDLLAHIRTDLDSFSEVEAYSLMLNGYRMVEAELRANLGEFGRFIDDYAATDPKWKFLKLERHFAATGRTADQDEPYVKHIKAARSRSFAWPPFARPWFRLR